MPSELITIPNKAFEEFNSTSIVLISISFLNSVQNVCFRIPHSTLKEQSKSNKREQKRNDLQLVARSLTLTSISGHLSLAELCFTNMACAFAVQHYRIAGALIGTI